MKTPYRDLYCIPPPPSPILFFLNVVFTPPPEPYFYCCFVALFIWLNGWLCHIWCYFTWQYNRSTYVKSWYLSTRRTLLYVLYNKKKQGIKFTELWHIMRLFASTLIWYHTRKQRHKGQVKRPTHHHKYILTLHACAHSSYLYLIE